MVPRPFPTRRLPRRPNLEQLRTQAKDLLAQYRANESAAVAEVQRFEYAPDPASFALSDAQRVLARAYGYESWSRLKAFVDGANVARLAQAVQAGDLAQARSLLRARPELVGMDMDGNDERRALHFAVLRRDPAMVRLLMRAGADARKGVFPHRDATAPFALARDRDYQDIVAIIEEEEQRRPRPASNSTDIAKAPAPATPVEDAVAQADAKRVRALVTADPGCLRDIHWMKGGLLTHAVKRGHIEIVRLLLDLGADVDERTMLHELEEPTPSWGTPLWHAALNGRCDIAELLLDRGADPNANVYASGWPLRNAMRHKDGELKRLLIERGAKPMPYMVAEANDVDEVRRMLEAGADEESTRELIWSAADHGSITVLELTLPRLNWAANDPRWDWILIQPIRSLGNNDQNHESLFACMAIMLRHGVDPNVSSRFGQTVMHYAAARSGPTEAERVRFVTMLLDHGARIDVRDDLLKSTPLGWACRWGRKEMAQLLIARGSPVEEPDAEPWATPPAWAVKTGHTNIAD
jgi:ankyrin repeat protein